MRRYFQLCDRGDIDLVSMVTRWNLPPDAVRAMEAGQSKSTALTQKHPLW